MKLNRYIDHTLLSPFSTLNQVKELCKEAIYYDFYAVCVSPYFAALAQELLVNSMTSTAIVVGFPYGYNSTKSKSITIAEASDIADEVDVVINLQALVSDNWKLISDEIKMLTTQAHDANLIIKWIVESGNISSDQLIQLCDLCNDAKVDFMKTSTGMLGTGATLEALQIMRSHLDAGIQIKASGGIRDRETALAFINAGATRIGASKSVAIVQSS